MSDTVRPLRTVLVGLGAAAAASSGLAAEFNYGLGYVSEYATNINAVPNNEQHEWINSAIGRVAYAENTETLVARLNAEVEYRDYAHNRATDEAVYDIDGSAVWTISPRRLQWTVDDVAQRVRLDPTGADTPANTSNANVFRTGPDLFFNVAQLHTLSFGARYINLYVSDSNVDNQAYTGAVRWLYQSTPTATWSLNLERQKVEFDDPVANENFRRNDAYLQLDKRFPQAQLVLAGGATRVERERSSELSGSMARLAWNYHITPESTFGLSSSVGYQDSGFELLGTVSSPTAPLTPGAPGTVGTDAVSADVYYNRYADMYYTLRRSRMEYRFRVRGQERDFQTTPQDRREAGSRVEVDYLHSATSTYGFYADYLKVKFTETFRTDEDAEVGLRYGYRLSRTTTLGLEARRHERQSTDANAEYVDNRFILTLLYTTQPLRLPNTQ